MIYNKWIIATSDSDQNTPFTNILNQYEYSMKQYLYNCVCGMVPNQLTLCINKRLKNEEDKTIITQLKMNCLIKIIFLLMYYKNILKWLLIWKIYKQRIIYVIIIIVKIY